jgi:hypothetical protein
MRKRVKTITEETHEYGTIVLENSLYEHLLNLAAANGTTHEHIDLWVEKTIKISEEVEGEALTVDHLPAITNGTPALPAAVEISKTA